MVPIDICFQVNIQSWPMVRAKLGKRPMYPLIMSTELVWPAGFEMMVQEAFVLTAAEVEIVRGITLGLPVKDIAAARGRAAETVSTQLRLSLIHIQMCIRDRHRPRPACRRG